MQSTVTSIVDPVEKEDNKKSGVILITQYFHSSSPVAREAMVQVLSRNLQSPEIAEVALINEREYDFTALQYSEKIKQYVSGRRLTFADAFKVANNFYPGRKCIVANSDIFFDHTLQAVQSSPLESTFMALTKWKALSVIGESGEEEEKISLFPRVDSQDAWIFSTPIPESIIGQSEFFLGAPKCDNRIAYLFSRAGYRYAVF